MTNTAVNTEISGLTIGDKAPDFKAPADGGAMLSLSEFAGQKNVVLYFYPKDDTPGCTIEAQDFRDLMDDFAKANTVIIGVSKDSVKSHDKFKAKHCLPFALASDEEAGICESYGVWVEKSMYGKKYFGIERATFLINKEGKIARIWNKVSVKGHAKEVLEASQKSS